MEPKVSCQGGTQAAAFWTGIDGYDLKAPASTTVEQIGTDSDCSGRNAPEYYAWWSLYPSVATTLINEPVAPGDVMSASVTESAASGGAEDFTLRLSDNGTGNGKAWGPVTETASLSTGSTRLATAEWIAEAPSLCSRRACQILPLADFGTVDFSTASATAGTVAGPIDSGSWSYDTITLTQPSDEAVPGALSDSGGTNAFAVNWEGVAPPAPPHGPPPGRGRF